MTCGISETDKKEYDALECKNITLEKFCRLDKYFSNISAIGFK